MKVFSVEDIEFRAMRATSLAPVLVLLAAGLPHAAQAQSFDCGKAETDTEWAICNTPELGKSDSDLATTYRQVLNAAKTPQERDAIQQLQRSWIHGNRDLCGGDVDCLTKAYETIAGALGRFQYPPPQPPANASVTPACNGDAGGDTLAGIVCGDDALLQKLRQVDALAEELRPRLPEAWRATFDAQQAVFASTAEMCPAGEGQPARCVSTAIDQRLQDVQDLAANWNRSLPDCAPGDVTIKDSDMGDGGMSQTLSVYLIEYRGTQTCRLRGYPAVSVTDADGQEQPTYVTYTGQTYFTEIAVPPLPVTLSPDNTTAWFGIHTAHACDSNGKLTVKVALPGSRDWLHSIDFGEQTCPSIDVTPVGMISTALSSV